MADKSNGFSRGSPHMPQLSSLRILHVCFLEHCFPEVTAQILRRSQIHVAPSEQLRQLTLHARDSEQARHVFRLELYEHVYIALCVEIRPQHGPELG